MKQKQVELRINEKVKVEVKGEVKEGYIAELHQERQNGAWMPVHGVRVTSDPYNKGKFVAYVWPEDLMSA